MKGLTGVRVAVQPAVRGRRDRGVARGDTLPRNDVVLYFSAVMLHWVVPSHPIHAMYTLFHLAMAMVPGHSGFEQLELGGGAIATNGYAHYLHHKYFEVNYADGAFPLGRWFGSFHDGSPEADAAMKRRRLARAGQ